MNLPAVAVADLRILEDALDGSPADILTSLLVLTAEAAQAVPSYLGLSVLIIVADGPPLNIATCDDADLERIGASVRFRVRGDPSANAEGSAQIELILYATQPGAFVDLAADLTWLTGRPWHDFHIDDDLVSPQKVPGTASLTSWSAINQARGLLLSRGLTMEEADSELDGRATEVGQGRYVAAVELLAEAFSTERPSAL